MREGGREREGEGGREGEEGEGGREERVWEVTYGDTGSYLLLCPSIPLSSLLLPSLFAVSPCSCGSI